MQILTVSKDRIAESFGKAAFHYDENAALQRKIGECLWQQMEKFCGETFVADDFSLLDLGCGSGYFTENLRQKTHGDVIALDIARGMLSHARQRCHFKSNSFFINADAEKLPLNSFSVDVIFSNFVLQWCDNLKHALSECLRVVKPGGCVGFSIPVAGTLRELQKSWRQIDAHSHVNSFYSEEDVKLILSEALKKTAYSNDYETHFSSYRCDEHYDTLKEILRNLKHIGANTVKASGRKGLMGKAHFAKLEENYEQFRCEKGLPISYEVLQVVINVPL